MTRALHAARGRRDVQLLPARVLRSSGSGAISGAGRRRGHVARAGHRALHHGKGIRLKRRKDGRTLTMTKDDRSHIEELAHLYVDGAFDRRELLKRVARVTGSIAAATVALESLGLAAQKKE